MMTYEESARYCELVKELNNRFNDSDYEYLNSVIAKKTAKGKAITEDWIRNALLEDVQDGVLTYSKALEMEKNYMQVIKKLR